MMTPEQWTTDFEDRRKVAYWDPIGKVWTNGIGHTGAWINDEGKTVDEVTEGMTWTDYEIDTNFELDYTRAKNQAINAVGVDAWDVLNTARQAVLTDLAFELGGVGLRSFTTFLSYVRSRMYVAASEDLKTTLLAHQVPSRVAANAWAMKTGQLELPPAHLS